MFTWICPKCGREVPPAYNDCPDCAPQAAGPAAPIEAPAPDEPPVERGGFGGGPVAQTPAPPPEAPPAAASPERPTPERKVFAPPPAARPRTSGAMLPTWLMAIVFAFAFLGLGTSIYWLAGRIRGHAAPSSTVESPAAKPGAPTNPFQRFVEISGIRFEADPKRKDTVLVRFLVVNHSEAAMPGLAGNVTLWGRTQRSEEDAEGTLTFKTSLVPFESKELTAPLTTKLRIYEMPDWQNLTTDVQITAPAEASGGSSAPR